MNNPEGRHEQEAGAPRSGDATGRDCRQTPTVAMLESRHRYGGGGVSQLTDEHGHG